MEEINEDEFNFGPYITLQDFYEGVECGVYGPDECCYWVYIDAQGNLKETPVVHPRKIPDNTIAVTYYAA